MATLQPEQIESADPNAWTGKPTSVAYLPEATYESWLTGRGLTAFSGKTEDEKMQIVIRATAELENMLRRWFTGGVVQDQQGLLYPARGAVTNTGSLLPMDGAPARYYGEAIALACEHIAAGDWMPNASAAGIKREGRGTGGYFVEYRDNVASLNAQHPHVWAAFQQAIPGV